MYNNSSNIAGLNVYDDMDNLILSEIKRVKKIIINQLASFHHLSICAFPQPRRYV